MKMEQTECSETSAYKLQTRGITQKKTHNIQNTTKAWNQDYMKDVKIKFLRMVKGYTAVEYVIEKYETNNYSDSGLNGCYVM